MKKKSAHKLFNFRWNELFLASDSSPFKQRTITFLCFFLEIGMGFKRTKPQTHIHWPKNED